MKKIATITFHASYNYGSCLQAYALQEYIKILCGHECVYNIINLRTDIQKKMYLNYWKRRGFKSILRRILFHRYKKELIKKDFLFENFISNYLNITEEYNTIDELKKSSKLNYDYFISGSDQLWNLNALDFDWSNYLEFTNCGKKISYAASFGDKKIKISNTDSVRIYKDLMEYSNISVREIGSYEIVKEISNIDSSVNVDPTMLLNKKDWLKIIPNEPKLNYKYIFLYNLKNDKEVINTAKKISKSLNIPLVISKCTNKYEILGTKKVFDVGPIEFLNLIENAELVISSSFHGTVFSIILNKPFYALNGLSDNRIRTLLKKMGLENRSICLDDYNQKIKNYKDIDFSLANKCIESEREKSKKYLSKALDL